MGNRTNNEFDFFHGREADQYSFYRIPKLLFTDKRFSKVSLEAKLLYGLLLDRMSLSTKNGWIDKDDRVYIYFCGCLFQAFCFQCAQKCQAQISPFV